jgi:prefoldin subunit 5
MPVAGKRVTSGLERWDEEYRNDPLWSGIDELISELQQASPDEDEQYNYDRLMLTLQVIYGYRDIPNILVSQSMMTNLRGVVQGHLRTQINNWIANSNQAHLDRAITQLNNALEHMRGWPVSKEKSLYSAARTVHGATSRFERRLAELEETIEQNNAQIGEFGVDQEKRFDEREERLLERFAELETNLSTADQGLKRIDTRLDSIINQFQERHESLQETRTEEWNDLLGDTREKFTESIRKLETDFDQTKELHTDQAHQHIDVMQSLKRQAQELVNATVTAGTSTEYGAYEIEQKKAADLLRIAAVALFAVATVVVVMVFERDSGFSDTDLGSVLMKASIPLPLIVAATVLMKESGKHRRQEIISKDLQLKIVAIHPFIANLDSGVQEKLRQEAAKALLVYDRRLGGDFNPVKNEDD